MVTDPIHNHQGVYFLSNDRIFDLTLAFLNSFRKYNPAIPLCLIPYNDDIHRIKKLQKEYNFSIYSSRDVLDFCDEISGRFHGKFYGHYRKLAMWKGDFDEFIYIDVDTVVLSNLDFVFGFLSEYDFVTSHSNLPDIEEWVWKKSIYDSQKLTVEQITYAANTGFIASGKKALASEDLTHKVECAVELLPHMNLLCKEQSFLNYVIVTSGKKYTSLHVLAMNNIYPDMKAERWAGDKHGVVKDGQISFDGKPDSVLLVHWAGKWQPLKIERAIFCVLVMLRVKRSEDELVMRYFMPYGKLWKHYRFLHENRPGK